MFRYQANKILLVLVIFFLTGCTIKITNNKFGLILQDYGYVFAEDERGDYYSLVTELEDRITENIIYVKSNSIQQIMTKEANGFKRTEIASYNYNNDTMVILVEETELGSGNTVTVTKRYSFKDNKISTEETGFEVKEWTDEKFIEFSVKVKQHIINNLKIMNLTFEDLTKLKPMT
ncbi:hypothetical protein RJG79_08130 [Mycoplasmatota bacterium WC44]